MLFICLYFFGSPFVWTNDNLKHQFPISVCDPQGKCTDFELMLATNSSFFTKGEVENIDNHAPTTYPEPEPLLAMDILPVEIFITELESEAMFVLEPEPVTMSFPELEAATMSVPEGTLIQFNILEWSPTCFPSLKALPLSGPSG